MTPGGRPRRAGTIDAVAGALPHSLLPDSAALDSSGALTVGGCSLLDLAGDYGTPLFVYDEAHLRARAREAVSVFGAGNVVYASKAFLCVAMARLAHEEGLLLDVATGGELHVALAADVPAEDLVLHGNNKSLDELRAAVNVGVGRVVVDSFDELDRLETLHAQGHAPPRVLLRITPGIHAHTHEYVQTGQDDSKFGFGLAVVPRRRRSSGRSGPSRSSWSASTPTSVPTCSRWSPSRRPPRSWPRSPARSSLPELILGGGLGVAYVAGEEAPSITEWGRAVLDGMADSGLDARLLVEPGRAIVASAAVTLYTIGTVKDIPGIRTYVAVDGGMSDNPRPVLYGSGYEAFLARDPGAERPRAVRVVGKHCESGDVLVHQAWVPEDLAVGDILATPVTGAYGHSMGSNYNKVPRPAVVFVRDGQARVVVRRETYDDLLRCDVP